MRSSGYSPDSTPKEQGFALLIVLVVLVALSLLWSAVLATARQSADDASTQIASLRLSGAFMGSLETIARDLSVPQASFEEDKKILIGSIAVEVRVRPEMSKVDFNYAAPTMIYELFRASGLSEIRARLWAERVIAARASMSRDRQGGPSHGRLRVLSELESILHANDDFETCLGSDITFFTHTPDVSIKWASERVKLAAQASEPDRYMIQRETLIGVVGGDAWRPDVFEISESIDDQEAHHPVTRQVSIRLTGNPRQPYWILSDRFPAPSAEESSAACARLAQSRV